MIKYKIKSLNVDNLNLSNWEKIKLNNIQSAIRKNKWDIFGYYPQQRKLTLKKNNIMMVINLSTNDVVTTMEHPTRFNTKLKRKGLTLREIELVIENPHYHTQKGEYLDVKGFENPSKI